MKTLEYIKKAFELKNQKYYKPAIEMLYKALEIENDNVEILFQIGELYFLLGNYSRAKQYLEKIENLQPEHVQSMNLKLQIELKQNNFETAYSIAKNLFGLQKNKQNLENLINLIIINKYYNDLELYKNLDIFDDDIKINTAQKLYEAGLTDKAEEFSSQCTQTDERVIFLNAKKLFDKGNFEEAKKLFYEISVNTQNPEILNYLGLFELENMNLINAIKNFSKAIALDNTKSKYYYNLGNAYFYNGWIEEAQKAYNQAIYLEPEILDYKYSLAYLYYETKDYEKSKNENNSILEIYNLHKQANVLKALLLLENKKPVDASLILENNLKNYPDDNFTKVTLSKVYLELNNFGKAKKLLEEVIKQNPQNLKYRTDFIELLIKETNFEQAISETESIVNEYPKYIEAYILGAKISYLRNDIENTRYYAQEALNLDINYSKGYYYLALSRELEGDNDEVIECLKRAILYDLNNPLYYAKMSEVYKKTKEFKSALNYLSEAIELSQDNEYKFEYNELLKIYTKEKLSSN